MALGLLARGAMAVGKAAAKALKKKKKPQARKATQKEYDAKMASRGKMTDKANKERYSAMQKPPPMKDFAPKSKNKKPMATKKTK